MGNRVIQHSSAFFRKLNQFSIRQVIQIKCDDVTVRGIVKEFGQVHEDLEKVSHFELLPCYSKNIGIIIYLFKMEGLVGRVTGVDEQDPSRLYIRFDSLKIYEWLDSRKSLPSAWMDHLESAETILDDEFQEIMAKIEALMFKAAAEGEIRIAKLLHLRHGMDANVLNAYGMSMLHIACQSGQKDFVNWLVNEVKVDVEKADGKGLRAIHHTTIRYYIISLFNTLLFIDIYLYFISRGDLEVLRMLIDGGAQLDSVNYDWKTALSIAIHGHKLDCVQLLVQRKCNVNAQVTLNLI